MGTQQASLPLQIGAVRLRNRFVATAHGSGVVAGGLAQPGDAEYWRRCAAGGAAMVIAGGTVVSPESANRIGNITEAWRPEAISGLRARASAISGAGAVPVCQLVHLGRETLGAEIWEHPIAPSSIRSPREPVRARAMTDADVDRMVASFVVSSRHAVEAGFPAIELHAAHGYLLAQFLSPSSNVRAGSDTVAGRARMLHRLHAEITTSCPEVVLGVRVSIDGAEEAGLDMDGLCELLPLLDMFDYVNVTAGVRTTYVRDMATSEPPLLSHVHRLRSATARPLLVSQAFRARPDIEAALAAGADLIGIARPLIADPQFPEKYLQGKDSQIRPCVSCNEDCRTFTPVLLCSVNPTLAPPGLEARPASPLQFGLPSASSRRVAVVGAGPAGLEATLQLGSTHEVTLFEAQAHIGGQLGVAAQAPNRAGWSKLLGFYADNLGTADLKLGHRVTPCDLGDFEEVIIATGATEIPTPGVLRSTGLIADRHAISPGDRVIVADDGFGSWLTVGAIESALAAGAVQVTVVVPGAAFAAGVPPESRVQLMKRLAGSPVEFVVGAAVTEIRTGSPGTVHCRHLLSGRTFELVCEHAVAVGERISSDWQQLQQTHPRARVQVIGDAVVPRRISHAIAEGYAAAQTIIKCPPR